jgi:hypothetical protein
MRKQNHHNECNTCRNGFKGCKKNTHIGQRATLMGLGFRNGKNGKKTMMTNAFVIMVSNVATQKKKLRQ